jgi:hypothetical protein
MANYILALAFKGRWKSKGGGLMMATRKSATPKSRSKRSTKTESNGAAEGIAPQPAAIAHAESSNGAAKSDPTSDQVRFRAYEIFLSRGGAHGDDWRDWFIAEGELSLSSKT